MRKIKRYILFLMFGISPVLYSQDSKKQIIDEVIAVVGNTPVLRSELDVLISQLDAEVVVTEAIKCELLKTLLIDKMLVHQAEIDSLPISDDEVNDRIDNNIRFFERQMNSRANVEKYLGMTVGEYKQQIFPKVKAQMLLDKMKQKIQSDVKITPKEIRDYFQKIPADSLPFISAEVEVAQIVVKPSYSIEAKEIAREQIELLKQRLLKGESFARLASVYSDDPGSKSQGGLLPEFGRGDMVPEFERTAYKMKKDSVSEIIETRYGYHILKLVDKRGDKVMVRHILIRPRLIDTDMDLAKLKIDSVLTKLRANTLAFCDAVKQYSEDEETKPNCGFFVDPNLGTQRIPFDYLDKDMAGIVTKLKPGQYSEPSVAYSPDGTPYYRILFLKVETKPHVANLEMDWQRVQSLALDDKREEALDTWAENKRKETFIHISNSYINCGYFEEWLSDTNKK
jgi:peptidyl-prolyl cis-trans isomerase SurA